MCRTFPTCESMDVILHRISAEIGSTADDLQEIEGQVASIIGGTNVDSLERLQSLDRLGQQLRALQDFLAFWQDKLEGPLVSVTVAHSKLIKPAEIKAIDGVVDSTLISGDFAVLSPAQAGQQVRLDIERAGVPQRFVLTAAEYSLTPVPASATLAAGSAKAGYLLLKDFIVQAESELTTRLDAIKAAGATDLIIDLRYNGGGRISTANHFASQVVGAVQAGKVFATLNYNAAHTASGIV